MRTSGSRADDSSARLDARNGSVTPTGMLRLTRIMLAAGRDAEPMNGTSLISTPSTNVPMMFVESHCFRLKSYGDRAIIGEWLVHEKLNVNIGQSFVRRCRFEVQLLGRGLHFQEDVSESEVRQTDIAHE